MTTDEQLLSILLSSKKASDLPQIDSLDNVDFIIVYDQSTGLLSTILKEKLALTGASGTSSKITVTIDNDGQTTYNLPSKPDNIDVSISRVPQVEGTDYTYNKSTGVLEIINASVGAAIKTDTLLDIRGYQNYFSKKESIIISSAGQSVFTLNDLPNNISLTLNRTVLYEGYDYDYDNTTGQITITNNSFINQITLNSILEARKIF